LRPRPRAALGSNFVESVPLSPEVPARRSRRRLVRHLRKRPASPAPAPAATRHAILNANDDSGGKRRQPRMVRVGIGRVNYAL